MGLPCSRGWLPALALALGSLDASGEGPTSDGGWAEVPVLRLAAPLVEPVTRTVNQTRSPGGSPGTFGPGSPASAIVEVANPIPGLTVLVKVDPWAEFFVASSPFSGDPRTAKSTGAYTANGRLDLGGVASGKVAIDVWLKSASKTVAFTLVAYADGTRRDVAALPAPVAAGLPVEGRAALRHFVNLDPADLEDQLVVERVLEAAPPDLFVYLKAGPLDGEVSVAKSEPLLFVGEAGQVSALTLDGERVFPSLEQLTATRPAKPVFPARVRKAHARPYSEADKKLAAETKAAEDDFNQCLARRRAGPDGEGSMGEVESANACGSAELDARRAATDKKLEAADLAHRTAAYAALKKRLSALLGK